MYSPAQLLSLASCGEKQRKQALLQQAGHVLSEGSQQPAKGRTVRGFQGSQQLRLSCHCPRTAMSSTPSHSSHHLPAERAGSAEGLAGVLWRPHTSHLRLLLCQASVSRAPAWSSQGPCHRIYHRPHHLPSLLSSTPTAPPVLPIRSHPRTCHSQSCPNPSTATHGRPTQSCPTAFPTPH